MRSWRWLAWLLLLGAAGCATAPTTAEPTAPAGAPAPAGGATETQAAAAPAQLKIGASSAEVNPSAGVMLGGYGYNRRCTGVHDPLYAKAVVFDDGATPVALVVVDSLGLQYPTVQEIRTAASQKVTDMALPPERIIVQSTHTRCAPDTIGLWGAEPNVSGVNPEYMAKLVATAADQVARAAVRREPGFVLHAAGECRGWVINRSEPSRLDTSVDVLQCVNADGDTIATLAHFACDPAVLDAKTTLVSSDFVGAYYRSMSVTLEGEHLFLQGAVGGWVQPDSSLRSFPEAQEFGVDLARAVVNALSDGKPMRDTAIRFNNKVFQIPVANQHLKDMTAAGITLRPYGDTVDTEVAWFSVGPAQFATHPGEATPALGWETERLMDTGPKFILGLGLDALGYILPQKFYNDASIPHGEYLVSMSPGPETAPAVMQSLQEIIP